MQIWSSGNSLAEDIKLQVSYRWQLMQCTRISLPDVIVVGNQMQYLIAEWKRNQIVPREMAVQRGGGTGNVVYWKPMKQNILKRRFCDVELCKQVGKEGIQKMPSRLSDEKISDGLSKSYLRGVLR